MKKLDTLAISIALLIGSQSANALTPWADGAPNITVRVSGAVAVNKAYTQVITDSLAATDTIDTFNDVDATTGSVGSNLSDMPIWAQGLLVKKSCWLGVHEAGQVMALFPSLAISRLSI